MRAQPGRIFAPPFPDGARWLNVAMLRMDQQKGRPVLVEFFDVAGAASMRTLRYLMAWHERYAADGLRVISVHVPGREQTQDAEAVAHAVRRLGIAHPVLLDHDGELWSAYGNEGWPARYIWNREGTLVDLHYGEGAYDDAEGVIAELLGDEGERVGWLRPEDDPEALIVVPTGAQEGAYSGEYEAGGVWVVASGEGTVSAGDHSVAIDGIGAYALIEHGANTPGDVEITATPGVTVHETTFTPGVAR